MDLHITGMTCQHCVASVTKAIGDVPGVEAVTVDLDEGTATITGQPDLDALKTAVAGAGYATTD